MGLLEILYTKIASFENSLSTRDFRTSLSGLYQAHRDNQAANPTGSF